MFWLIGVYIVLIVLWHKVFILHFQTDESSTESADSCDERNSSDECENDPSICQSFEKNPPVVIVNVYYCLRYISGNILLVACIYYCYYFFIIKINIM